MTVLALRTHLRRFSLSAALLLTVFGKCWCQSSVSIDAFVPAQHEVIGEDQYVCFRVDLPKESLKIVGVDPLSTQDVVHHMLLFGTDSYARSLSVYLSLQNCHGCCISCPHFLQTISLFLLARPSAESCNVAAKPFQASLCKCLSHNSLCASPTFLSKSALLPGCELESA